MTNYCPIPGASQPEEPVRLIDANEAIEALDRAEIELYPSEYKAFQKEIDKIPTIDPETLRPTAKWSLGRIEDHIVMNFICGNCGARSELNYKYCPKCGARMIKNDKGW